MAVEIKHKKTSTKPDSSDASLILPSDWNDTHNIEMAALSLLGNPTAAPEAAAEITLGLGLGFNASALDVKIGTEKGLKFAAGALEVDLGTGLEFDEDGKIRVSTTGVPIGTMVHSAVDLTSAGFLLANGAPVTALYPDLRAALIAAGSPFGSSGGDPLLPDEVTAARFRRAANGTVPVGTVQEDQMQQITGSITGSLWSSTVPVATGAIGRTPGSADRGGGGAVANTSNLTFDSANSPGARTGAETRPKSIAYLPYIKAFGTVSIEGMADLAELLTAIATEAEATLGTNNTKLMTPLRTAQHFASAIGPALADFGRADVLLNFNAQGVASIRYSRNVDSILDIGVGWFRINFTDPAPNANFILVGCVRLDGVSDARVGDVGIRRGSIPTTTTVEIQCTEGTTTAFDPDYVLIAIFF